MHPILFKIGNVTVYTYGLFIATAFIAGILLAKNEAKRLGEDPERIMDLCFYILIAAIVGSRLFYVATNPAMIVSDPLEIFKIWKGGLVFYGGFILAVLTGVLFILQKEMKLWRTADMMAPSIAAGQTIGRIGCFFAGCCYGKACDYPWAITFRNVNSLAPVGIPLHPAQLYHALGNLIIFALIWYFRPLKKFDGQLFWMYVLFYGVFRMFLEIFRGDHRGHMFWGVFSVSQIIGGIMAVVAVIMMVALKRGAGHHA